MTYLDPKGEGDQQHVRKAAGIVKASKVGSAPCRAAICAHACRRAMLTAAVTRLSARAPPRAISASVRHAVLHRRPVHARSSASAQLELARHRGAVQALPSACEQAEHGVLDRGSAAGEHPVAMHVHVASAQERKVVARAARRRRAHAARIGSAPGRCVARPAPPRHDDRPVGRRETPDCRAAVAARPAAGGYPDRTNADR